MDYSMKRKQGSGANQWGPLFLECWLGSKGTNEVYGEEELEEKHVIPRFCKK